MICNLMRHVQNKAGSWTEMQDHAGQSHNRLPFALQRIERCEYFQKKRSSTKIVVKECFQKLKMRANLVRTRVGLSREETCWRAFPSGLRVLP